ncbi:substrate-specific component BioY of biotin ECF transporter [Lachnospiraceae bacterium KM106-2]|nr:substrate-specific component BioY of biotin ECF transporter [Lachnospiraceae bacterium KM106-2]
MMRKTQKMTMCALCAALVGIGAFIQIPVPYMDYFTLQFLFVLLTGMILGKKLGVISVATYVGVGLVGFPVFAAGGGVQYIFRPSFGYLIGFIAAAFAVGAILEKLQENKFINYLIAAFGGFFVTYSIGLTYKYIMLNTFSNQPTSFKIVLLSCFPLDMPGDLFLCVMSAILAVKMVPLLRRMNEYA